jgi:hypothetical protein
MKRTFPIVVAGFLAAALAGCGGGSTASTAASTSAAASSADAGVAAAGGASAGTGTASGAADAGASAAHAALPTGMAGADAIKAGLGTDGAPIVSVIATDTTCKPVKTSIKAGKIWFKITNKGTKITELYLEKADASNTELIQVEKIRPGQSGAFSTSATAGHYMVACEPGMAGHDTQVRAAISVM